MRTCWRVVAGASLLALAGACASRGAPAARSAAPPPPPAAAPPAPPPMPAASSTPSAAPPPVVAAPASDWHEIVSAPYPDMEIAAFDAGAVVAARSFVAVVAGDTVTQDPRFIAGLPEWVNWDAGVYVQVPDAGAVLLGGLPRSTHLSAHAGNRHGPDFDAWWTPHGWTPRAPPRDPRLAKIPRAGPWADELSLSFKSGALLVVRFDNGANAYDIRPGAAKPLHTRLPIAEPGYKRALVGSTPDDVTLCDVTNGVYHYDGTAWSSVDVDFVPASCAVANDGTLWVVTEAPARIVRRRGEAWSDVPLPDGVTPMRVVAAGQRAFALGSTDTPQRVHVYSTLPVAQRVDVDEHNLPGPLFIDGITGLDVTSVDTVSVSGDPAGPGTRACTSLVAWLGPGPVEAVATALGASAPRLLRVSGTAPGTVFSLRGAQMGVRASGKRREGVVALPASYDEGVALVAAANAALPAVGARLLCAKPRRR